MGYLTETAASPRDPFPCQVLQGLCFVYAKVSACQQLQMVNTAPAFFKHPPRHTSLRKLDNLKSHSLEERACGERTTSRSMESGSCVRPAFGGPDSHSQSAAVNVRRGQCGRTDPERRAVIGDRRPAATLIHLLPQFCFSCNNREILDEVQQHSAPRGHHQAATGCSPHSTEAAALMIRSVN